MSEPKLICDTTAIQYLHQLDLLHLLGDLAPAVWIPRAVVAEMTEGRRQGVDLPSLEHLPWVMVRETVSDHPLPVPASLGSGETQVLRLTLDTPDAVAVLDDARARRMAANLGIRFTGTLGLLLDARQKGLIKQVSPILDRLDQLNFYLSSHARKAILKLAGETA